MYNEVVARANNGEKRLVLKGFFYKTTKKGRTVDEPLARKMEMHARRLGLPFIAIKETERSMPNEISLRVGILTVYLNDNYYHITGDDTPFMANFSEEQNFRFISREELRDVTDYLRSNGTDDKEIAKIEAAHEEADTKRQKAVVTFDEDGKIDTVEKCVGLGENEVKYLITSGGYARCVNVPMERAKLRESLASMGSGRMMMHNFDHPEYSPMSRSQVESIVAEACESLDEGKKSKVTSWLNGILPDVEQKSFNMYGRRSEFGSLLSSGYRPMTNSINLSDMIDRTCVRGITPSFSKPGSTP